MGFYIRKSLRVGLMRFNLSKSGIGVSTGFKGFRVGTGPRGNYVHMGRDGIYYRASLPGTENNNASQNKAPGDLIPSDIKQLPLNEIESGSVLNMVDGSSSSLLEELNTKHKKLKLWPFVAALSVIFVWFLSFSESKVLTALAILFALPTTLYFYYKDQLVKSVILFYEVENSMAQSYQLLHDAFEQISGCKKIWHIEAKGQTQDSKKLAGANFLVRRKAISLSKKSPPYVKTNIAVPMLPAGRQSLYFFPDRLLVFDRQGVWRSKI